MSEGSGKIHIRDVWGHNLEQEIRLMRDVVDDYPYVGMDTEFPGVVLKHLGNTRNLNQYHYLSLKDNVDILKLIQLGLALSDEHGNLPTCGGDRPCVWQFNFREFNIARDIFAVDSIVLLRESGIDFKKHTEMGIDCNQFAQLLMSSGIVLNPDVRWVTFHCAYDFGYLLKLLTGKYLPATVGGFFGLIKVFFPVIYDIKHLMRYCDGLYGGLNRVAELLGVERHGTSHQAGSDSLLTLHSFNKLKEVHFKGSLLKYESVLYGLEPETEI